MQEDVLQRDDNLIVILHQKGVTERIMICMVRVVAVNYQSR